MSQESLDSKEKSVEVGSGNDDSIGGMLNGLLITVWVVLLKELEEREAGVFDEHPSCNSRGETSEISGSNLVLKISCLGFASNIDFVSLFRCCVFESTKISTSFSHTLCKKSTRLPVNAFVPYEFKCSPQLSRWCP